MKKISLLLLTTVILFACKTSQKAVAVPQSSVSNITIEGKLFSVAFMQRAAEYSALCFQAYNIARQRVDESLMMETSRPRAIITDIDETLLDNSAEEVHQGLLGKGFDPVEWTHWTSLAIADTVPGALTFFKFAASKGVEIFYVTNREEKEREGTLKNLEKFNFPYSDNEHLILKQDVSSKEARRQQIMKDHDVILLIGDNLSDFSALWDAKTVEQRLENVQKESALFGSRFIVLPNPVYGDWENALYRYKRLTPAQQDSTLKTWLKNY